MSQTALDRIPILTFELGDALYGLFIDYVVEVAAMVHYAPIADARPELLGLVNRHGQVLPLIDLRLVFGLSAPPIDAHVLFIVAMYEGNLVGLVVDVVNQVQYIHSSTLKVAPGGSRWVEQVASYGGKLLQVINLSTLMTHLLPESMTTLNQIEDSN